MRYQTAPLPGVDRSLGKMATRRNAGTPTAGPVRTVRENPRPHPRRPTCAGPDCTVGHERSSGVSILLSVGVSILGYSWFEKPVLALGRGLLARLRPRPSGLPA